IDTCGNCDAPAICGGGGVPSQCGGGTGGGASGGGPGCTNLCQQQVYCPGGRATTVTGTVYAPNGTLPLPGVFVYVPNADLPAIPEGVSCDRCVDEDLGEPLVSAVSANDGTFTLQHVPAGVTFPLVVKTGKWRRVVTVGPFDNCSANTLTAEQTRLPKNRVEGNIPRFAIVTGRVDALECVLRKACVDDDVFGRPILISGNPSNPDRIHLYRSNGAWADQQLRDTCDDTDDATPTDSCENTNRSTCCTNYGTSCNDEPSECREQLARNLYGSADTLNNYDVVLFGCDADLNGETFRQQQWEEDDYSRMRNYINNGGRLFLSHYTYQWLRLDPAGTIGDPNNHYNGVVTFSGTEGRGSLQDTQSPALIDT
ncbi:MAG: hypothetical protein ACO3JL_21845, partial [Myxococcota bacterium]